MDALRSLLRARARKATLALAVVVVGGGMSSTWLSGHAAAWGGGGGGGPTATLWVQKFDSCATPLGGAKLLLLDSHGGIAAPLAVTANGPQYVFAHPDGCPTTNGSCVTVPTGCATFAVPIPQSGTATYYVVEVQPPPGYQPCWFGDRQCLFNVLTVTIASDGTMQVVDSVVFPDWQVDSIPTASHPDINTGNPYWQGTQSDPAHIYDGREKSKQPCNGQGK